MNNFLKNALKKNQANLEEFGNMDDGRVSLDPGSVHSGGTVYIKYHGLLKSSGADHIFLHYGVDGWNNISTIKMNRIENGDFGTDIKADAGREINFCFKDSANNWDNNNGVNWKADVHQ